MLQSLALPAPLMLQPATRRIATLHAGVCSQRSAGHAWMQPSPRSAPSTVVHARLPHMDEELEHMQWQLDKRTHDGPAGTNANHSGSSRHSTKTKRSLVFHERHTGKERERNHSRAHRVQQQQQQRRRHLHASSSGSSSADATGSSSCDEATVAAAEAAARGEYGVLDQQQQQARQQDEQFYCLHLDHAAAAQDLHKTQERLAKHIQEDGGCCVSAGVGQASLLTQLLLLLQHKQLHRRASKWGSDTVLLLQPLSCEPLPDDSNNTSTAAVAVAAASLQDTAIGVSAAAGQHGMSTVVRSGTGAHHLSCACPVDELQFFATFMPLHALLSVEHGSSAAAAAAAAVLPGEIPDSAVGISAAGRAASLQSWSAAESSTEDAAAAASTTSSSSSSKHARQNKSTVELLRAASSSSGGVAAVLLDAAERGHLRCVHVGLHADAATTAASIVGAVAAGDVLALHVKQNGAAHAVAFSALEVTSRMLHSSTQQQQGFGVLLVPGHSHEHVHARTHGHGHGHAHGSAAPMDMHQQGAGSAAAAAVQEAQHGHHQHHGKVADVSMDVGGIGAAFYGLGGWGDRGGQQQQGVSHKHGQEVWLCVVPLGVGA